MSSKPNFSRRKPTQKILEEAAARWNNPNYNPNNENNNETNSETNSENNRLSILTNENNNLSRNRSNSTSSISSVSSSSSIFTSFCSVVSSSLQSLTTSSSLSSKKINRFKELENSELNSFEKMLIITEGIENNNKRFTNILLKNNLILNSSVYKNILISAIKKNNQLLIDKIINSKLNGRYFDTELLIAAVEYGNIELVEFLIKKNIAINDTIKTTEYGIINPLIAAIINKQNIEKKLNYKIIELLINKGANVNYATLDGKIPLILAIDRGNLEIINLLINKRATIKISTIDGYTTLMAAITSQNEEIINLIKIGYTKNNIKQEKNNINASNKLNSTTKKFMLNEINKYFPQ